MATLFEPAGRESLIGRLNALQPAAERVWGTMDPAQMLAHCSAAMETATGRRPRKQAFLGRIVTPFIRAKVLGLEPFRRSTPTDPTFVVTGARDFAAERSRLLALIDHFVERGASLAGNETHSFFGKLSGEEWGVLMYKHLDHHLRQFAA